MDEQKVRLTEQVVELLNEELEYQNDMAGTDRADTADHGITGQLLTMEEYLSTARTAWVHNKGDMASLDVIRKVVAIGIRALVRYGCPKRERKHIALTPETCDCSGSVAAMCPVCDGGLEICAVCGMAEIELDQHPICPGPKR